MLDILRTIRTKSHASMISLTLVFSSCTSVADAYTCHNEFVFQVGDVIAWRPVSNNRSTAGYFFQSGMYIDADGAPDAYHPRDIGTDKLSHAGRPGKWWGVVTHNLKRWGKPVVQKSGDPKPGYYVSQTSLFDPRKRHHDPARYVNANAIPYIALPRNAKGGAQVGDIAAVYNAKNDRLEYAIFADVGGTAKKRVGEGSVALAKALGIKSNPRSGGTRHGIYYVVFPQSGDKRPKSKTQIRRLGEQLFAEWGGLSRLSSCDPNFQIARR